jgi:hypothetical protein
MPTMSRPLYRYGGLALVQAGLIAGGFAAALSTSPPPPVPVAAAQVAAPQVRVIAAVTAPVAATTLARRAPVVRSAPRRTAVKAPRRVVRHVAVRPTRVVRPALVRQAKASSWSVVFASSVERIPGYRSGTVSWQVTDHYGSWGTADWYRGIVYISPRVPLARLYDVSVHEWSHLLSVAAYGGDVDAAVAAMNGWFGGSGLAGAERAADCMALALGARWTHYTACDDARWRAGAARLVKGERL